MTCACYHSSVPSDASEYQKLNGKRRRSTEKTGRTGTGESENGRRGPGEGIQSYVDSMGALYLGAHANVRAEKIIVSWILATITLLKFTHLSRSVWHLPLPECSFSAERHISAAPTTLSLYETARPINLLSDPGFVDLLCEQRLPRASP